MLAYLGLGEDFLFELGLFGSVSMNLFPLNSSLSKKIVKLIGKLWYEQLSELRTMLSPFSPNMYLLHPIAPEKVGRFTEEMAVALNLLSEPRVTIQIQNCDDSATLARSASRTHHLRQRKKMINLVKYTGRPTTFSAQIFNSKL